MAILFVKETDATETVAATTLTLTPANVAGNLLVLNIASRPGTTTVTSVADTGGNTWTQATVQSGGYQFYSRTTAIAGTVTITVSVSATVVAQCFEFSGIPASPLDVAFNGANGATAAPATGTSGVTTQASEVVVACIAEQGSRTFSAQTAGYTLGNTSVSNSAQPITMQAAWQILSATGAQAYGATASSANTWTAQLSTYKGSLAPPGLPRSLAVQQAVNRAASW